LSGQNKQKESAVTLADACRIIGKDLLKNRVVGGDRYNGKHFQPKAKVSKARLWLIKNGHKAYLYQKESKMLNIVSADESIEDKCKAAIKSAALIDAINASIFENCIATVESYAVKLPARCECEAARSPEIIRFLDEIESVCVKYGMSISHEDSHGGFIIERHKQENIDWLKDASDER
jgi:hypothetical protein